MIDEEILLALQDVVHLLVVKCHDQLLGNELKEASRLMRLVMLKQSICAHCVTLILQRIIIMMTVTKTSFHEQSKER